MTEFLVAFGILSGLAAVMLFMAFMWYGIRQWEEREAERRAKRSVGAALDRKRKR